VNDLAILEEAFERAAIAADAPTLDALRRIERCLARQHDVACDLVRALQRLSGPLMAKAVEDTSFYRYRRLLALNEVGGEPDSAGTGPDAFHRKAAWRLAHWPDNMLASATHDTKRGEDARARLAVLSELPAAWEEAAAAWRELNRRLPAIHPADEYALYQSLVGAWPPGLAASDEEGLTELGSRVEGWLVKALREGKERSDWNDPNADYESRAKAFLQGCLGDPAFSRAIAAFVARLEPAATANSLGQLLVKLTAPGVPDIYQGTELWDDSLVDPDNRRPVDFAHLAGMATAAPKQATVAKVLRLRAKHPELFARGRYRPLSATGRLADHVLAYARVEGDEVAVVIVTRLWASRGGGWGDSELMVPREWRGLNWHDRLNDVPVRIDNGNLHLDVLLAPGPVALLSNV
jgi:maltooligosyltrehalose synthase